MHQSANPLRVSLIKYLPYGVHCSLTATTLACTQLKATRGVQDVLSQNGKDVAFSNDASNSLTYSDKLNPWILIKCNKPTIKEGLQGRRVNKGSGNLVSNWSQWTMKINWSRPKWCTQMTPTLSIYPWWPSSTSQAKYSLVYHIITKTIKYNRMAVADVSCIRNNQVAGDGEGCFLKSWSKTVDSPTCVKRNLETDQRQSAKLPWSSPET